MVDLLTARQVSDAAGVAPSTFRAYVARGQAPRPVQKRGGTNLWSPDDIAHWRQIKEFSGSDHLSKRVDASARLSRARHWEESVHREMAQIGLNPAQAQCLIDGYTPSGMSVDQYRDARAILEEHRRLKRSLKDVVPSTDTRPEREIVSAYADEIARGADVFEVLTDMTVDLVQHGLGEILLPRGYTPAFWDTQSNAQDWTEFMMLQDRVEIPEGL